MSERVTADHGLPRAVVKLASGINLPIALLGFSLVGFIVGIIEVAAGLSTGDPIWFQGAAVAIAVGACFVIARRDLDKERVGAALTILGVGLFGGAIAYSIVLPGSPAVILVPMVFLCLALTLASGRFLYAVAAASWIAGNVLVALNLTLAPTPSPLALVAFRIFSFAVASGVGILLLVGFGDRLRAGIVAQKARARQSEEMVARTKELAELKNTFMNTASHELRTPLTPINIQLALLSGGDYGPLSAGQRRSLEVLERNLRRLTSLVEDLSDASRLQSGRLRLDAEPTDVGTVLRETLELYKEPAGKSGVSLDVEAPEHLVISADPRRLTQVLDNFVSNALRFTPRGGHVVLHAERRARSVVAWVKDDGAGIPPEKLDLLFQPFSQLHHMGRARSGTGLGLFISRGIIEQHGGHVWAQSDGEGKGALFGFEIPGARPSP
ncbi:MAG: HAMP domain-containing histidine kinase [Euryarchaeota archaeon]|nr:HAMP domain-containing histidine kinase [Euryarchaeota archaeon]